MTDSPGFNEEQTPPAEALEPAPARPEIYLKKPPLWSYFLTPVAVLLGAAMIAGMVWWTDDEPAGDTVVLGAIPGDRDSVSTDAPPTTDASPAATMAPAASLLTTFNLYARSLELDMAAFGQCLGQQANVAMLNEHVQRGSALGVGGTPTFFINNKRLVGAQPAAILEEIVQKELNGGATSLDDYSQVVRDLGNNFAIIDAPPDLTGAVFEGSPDAGVVIAEFSDFQCPFCKRWNEQVLPGLREELGDQVALAFLHYPITQIHPNAGNASVVAICAGQQGKFWEMHDILFARQAEWSDLR